MSQPLLQDAVVDASNQDFSKQPEISSKDLSNTQTTLLQPSARSLLPCVLPQTSKVFRGRYFSPFVRAYPPELSAVGIDCNTFVTFIDGLNEAFIAHPVWEAINIAGSVIATFGYIKPVVYTGTAMALGSVVGSKATSYGRTKAYLKAINTDLFNPAGLNVSIMPTAKMMEHVGYPEEKLNLPPLETLADIDETEFADSVEEGSMKEKKEKIHTDDPRMRRIRALEGYVGPLDFDVPAAVSPDTLLKRMGDAQAHRLSRKQQASLAKTRDKGNDKYYAKQDKAAEAQLKGEQEIAKLERKLGQEQQKFDTQLNIGKAGADLEARNKVIQKHSKENAKIEADIEKEKSKMHRAVEKYQDDADKALQKAPDKESKIAQKIRWVVVAAWNGEDDGEALSEVTSNASEI